MPRALLGTWQAFSPLTLMSPQEALSSSGKVRSAERTAQVKLSGCPLVLRVSVPHREGMSVRLRTGMGALMGVQTLPGHLSPRAGLAPGVWLKHWASVFSFLPMGLLPVSPTLPSPPAPLNGAHFLLSFLQSCVLFLVPSQPSRHSDDAAFLSPGTLSGSTEARAGHISA